MLRASLERITLTGIMMFVVGGAIIVAVVVGSVLTLVHGKYTTTDWFNLLAFGLALGGIYALIALGYTLVYGVLRMINFAHSEVFMAGPFTAFFVADALARSNFLNESVEHLFIGLFIIFVVAMTISTLVAVGLERIAYRPLRGAPRLVPLITAIGASFFLQYFFKGLYGPNIHAYPDIAWLKQYLVLGNFQIQYIQVMVILASIIMMAGLQIFIMRSKTGKAMRAVSEDKPTAALMGIDVDRIIVITFMLGGALAGAAGVMYALMFKQVGFLMGFFPGIKAFTAAVLGGIGSVPGAMLGGLFLGVIESIGPILFLDGLGIPAPYQLKDAIAFVLLVLVLIFRPSGILGERLARKKA
jgi:branched-chain amino acid transport system permease protein